MDNIFCLTNNSNTFQHWNIDLEAYHLSKGDFINLLIRNNIFFILNYVIVEEKTDDKDFIVCSYIYYL